MVGPVDCKSTLYELVGSIPTSCTKSNASMAELDMHVAATHDRCGFESRSALQTIGEGWRPPNACRQGVKEVRLLLTV